jgi:hypothetical protein
VAGVAAAVHPAVVNHSGASALDGPAQAASVVAFAAVLAALAARRDYVNRDEEPATAPAADAAEPDLPETDVTPSEPIQSRSTESKSPESSRTETPEIRSPLPSAVD